jgi:TPR repeat protein
VEKGNPRAQRLLGDLYAGGRGVARDDAEARVWYERAGKQYDVDAQAKLGEMYAAGIGVSRDPNLAYVWYAAAARNGNAVARAHQERIAAGLQPAELEQLNRTVETLVAPSRRR